MKLLAKTAEDRYQSTLGLKADLETCLTQLQTDGEICHFLVGQLDSYSQFSIPQKLYGREIEVATLLEAFDRVSTDVTRIISSTPESASDLLDLATVIKASQALSGEIVLGKLLSKLMTIVLENAGAQTGYLILEKSG